MYYELTSQNPNRMLLFNIAKHSIGESWTMGRHFKKAPPLPVIVRIQPGNENSDLLPLFDTPPLMSNEFYEAMREAGVDNLDVYDAIIRSEDGSVEYHGYKAFCIVGLISAADLKNTIFSPDNPSRLFDASIERLEIDESKTNNVLCFRLAEYTGSIFIHEKVKQHLEKKNFPHVVFNELKNFISL
jgi:hypothetical protein